MDTPKQPIFNVDITTGMMEEQHAFMAKHRDQTPFPRETTGDILSGIQPTRDTSIPSTYPPYQPISKNKNLTVINLFAGPGAGKSVTRAGTFAKLKLRGENVEEVTEFAKDLVWEERYNLFTEQDFIFAEQHRRQRRLIAHNVKYTVTDSPLLLALLYRPSDYYKSFEPFVLEIFNSFNNINIFIDRPEKYEQQGRNESPEQAKDKDHQMMELLWSNNIPFYVVKANDYTVANADYIYMNHDVRITPTVKPETDVPFTKELFAYILKTKRTECGPGQK